MNTLLFSILALTVIILVHAKPQGIPATKQDSQVKTDKQYVYELPTTENKERTLLDNSYQTKSRAQNTKEILDKISKLNTELGYTNKKSLKSTDYDEINTDGYNRALQSYPRDPYQHQHFYSNRGPEIRQSSPFDNPITEYLKSLNEKSVQNTIFSRSGDPSDENYGNDNVENSDNDEEIPKGHVIKRKIIHRQNIMIPNPLMMMNQQGRYPTQPMQQYQNNPNAPYFIGGIPVIQQFPPQMFSPQAYAQQPYSPDNTMESQSSQRGFGTSNISSPLTMGYPTNNPQGRQLSWPFQSYFPIVINDPFLSFYNAFSQMIEYGPEADLCKRVSNIFKGKPRPKSEEISIRAGKSLNSTARKTRSSDDEDDTYDEDTRDEIVIDQLALHTPKKKLFESFLRPRKVDSENDDDLSPNAYTSTDTMLDSQDDSRGPAGDKTLFSKDNMGNGIFIHKLKVRKGGVAIAGPGGIATAGSGGTAVVGPGGYAYTQPNGVAIAGPGAKIYSIPEIHNLTEIVLKAHADGKSLNKNGEPRSLPPGSKVVATGPIVYHNKGDE